MDNDKIDVNYVADLARLELSDDEVKRFSSQLDDILGYVRQLEQLDVSGIEAMAHATPVYDVMRRDEARPGNGTQSALANAPEKSGDQFRVTRVVES
jgi:aspartyl-tRNA(Asn)/glutamyl-tRNA(Gln) amidotransferase subunit C